MLILGIESTCDETACAVVKDGQTILSNVIYSQSVIHERYGGVYPEIAARHHADLIIPMIEKALQTAGITHRELAGIAVAQGPGLVGSLLIGINAAKALAYAWDLPLIGVNHVEAHLYAAMMNQTPCFPVLGCVLSGGHSFIAKISSVGQYELIATTVDDAMGEAFDKVARLMNLPYPGGMHIERLAQLGDTKKYPLKAGQVKGNPLALSYSGIKTNVLYLTKGANATKNAPLLVEADELCHIAASFQETVFQDLLKKVQKIAASGAYTQIYFGGGVTQNARLREKARNLLGDKVFFAAKDLCLDNGAMIAGLGYHKLQECGALNPEELEPKPSWPFRFVE